MTISPSKFQALAIAKALEVYARSRISVNRAYTPRNMMLTAQKITGRHFKPQDYTSAANALKEWAEVME